MMGLFELAAFFVGTGVVSYAAFLFGKASKKNCFVCRILDDTGYDLNNLTEEFDQKVDIVCNACGLVAEVECAACGSVEE